MAWLSVWSEVQTCIWPSWCHCHSLSLASVKSRLVLPFWYWLTWIVPEKGLLTCVCVCIYVRVLCCRYSVALMKVQPISYRRTSTICSAVTLTPVKNAVSRHGQIVCSGDVNLYLQLQALVCWQTVFFIFNVLFLLVFENSSSVVILFTWWNEGHLTCKKPIPVIFKIRFQNR